MPSWGGILKELANSKTPGGKPDFDKVRRKYLAAHHQRTKRAVILYATKWTDIDPEIPPDAISVADADIQGFMEACYEVPEKELDLLLHSPGGSLEAAEAIVQYLRDRFQHIRVIVPQAAMSAATMIACAADEIVLGEHSSLGPIDPQFILNTALGKRVAPAQAIRDQFALAKKECQDPKLLGAWLPMLSQFGPDLLVQCANASILSHDLVQQWLEKYMFRGDGDAHDKAVAIADWLADHNEFKSHGRHIPRSQLEAKKMKIKHLEQDPREQDDLLSVFHATTHTFTGTGAVKIIENHKGNAWVNQIQKVLAVQGPVMGPFPGAPGGGGAPHAPFKKKLIGEA
ncbi:MAG: serine protease [Betaproteobacteria bacterium]|nr:MAG: serine protease [Betaproteobacteria bacterium]